MLKIIPFNPISSNIVLMIFLATSAFVFTLPAPSSALLVSFGYNSSNVEKRTLH
jgi:hypothetical protein